MSNEITEIVKKAADRIEAVEKAQQELDKNVNKSLDEIVQRIEGSDGRLNGRQKSNVFAPVFADQGVKSFMSLRRRDPVNITVNAGIADIVKSVMVGDTAGSSEDGYAVQPQRAPGLYRDARRRLSLLEALPKMRVTSNTFEFNVLDGYVNLAGYQSSEGATKPETSVPTDLKSVSIKTIAHWLPISEQLLADEPGLSKQLMDLMRYGAFAKLERELILGTGSPGQIGGLTDSGNYTAFTPSTSTLNAADAIGEAQAYLDAAGWVAGLVIMHPDDWQAMRAERATTSNEYLVGSWSNPAPPNVWGIPVVTSPFMQAGNVIVLDPSQAVILDRQDAAVGMGRIDDQFTRNVVTLRAELRAGLAVFAPSAVLYFEI